MFTLIKREVIDNIVFLIASVLAAAMLACCASLPVARDVPSFRIRTVCPPD